ncbi:pyridoxamine 5'-phosphate oxidase [Colletotrichum higginsianum IMI 349063]|uniref:pyridoxal 5'-phosphate synthase n=1 Tax=Colletotrichum higginsianum (strain IMI 349063) TaxID=759273 RepID=A0A1B7YAC6_COLHI|nr:pyridoxamine 5'-phosphate oxidase [Colletotrichum higginsianum IMI 349063]OBR09022.1 pyridoxamine 5'-phosphate oxidase [Colletotrichum higginsianum IMI 349063]
MALHPAPEIAPAGSAQNTRADQFTLASLSRASLHPSSPIPQFHDWFTTAQQSHAVPHPETCTLSTASLPSGRVSARMVYLKELDARGGFVVYTNLGTSRKAADLATNKHASLTFWWEALQRQVRVEGVAGRLSPEESQVYFDTRVRGSRLGAWASRQSQVLEPRPGVAGDGEDDGRAQLEDWVREVEERFKGEEKIPVPDFWGGLRIVPERIEFWQGRENRLHDRFVYDKAEGEGEEWTINRLSP